MEEPPETVELRVTREWDLELDGEELEGRLSPGMPFVSFDVFSVTRWRNPL